VVGGVAVALTAGALLWATGVRPANSSHSGGLPVQLPSPSPDRTVPPPPAISPSRADPSPAGSGGPGADAGRQQSTAAREGAGRSKPEVVVQVVDTQEGRCPRTFDVGVNAFVTQGRIDEGTAELRVPFDRIRRTRPLLQIAGEFSGVITGVPTKRTASLTVTFRGPAGEVTEVHDITHACPGKPTDRLTKRFGFKKMPKFTAPKIKSPRVEFDFDFDFDGPPQEGGRGAATPSRAPASPSPGR
jgi:hypothetical protein